MSSGVILLQRPYISFSSPLLLILRREITAAAVALSLINCEVENKLCCDDSSAYVRMLFCCEFHESLQCLCLNYIFFNDFKIRFFIFSIFKYLLLCAMIHYYFEVN